MSMQKTTTPPHVLFPGLASGDFFVTRYGDPSHPKKQPHSGLSHISAKPKHFDTCVANTKRSGTCNANNVFRNKIVFNTGLLFLVIISGTAKIIT